MIADALEITVPDSADLTNDGSPGGYAYGSLGAVTVTDGRASLTPAWTATVTSTSFTTGGGGAGETIANTSTYYFSGDETATTGDGTFTPGQAGAFVPPPAPAGDAMGGTVTAFSHSGGSGNNSAEWNPSLTVAVALNNVVGQYTGTVAHTVT